MPKKHRALNLIAANAALGVTTYLAYLAKTWLSYGRISKPAKDPLLDRFMPDYEVREHHRIRVAAPAEDSLRAALELDMSDSRQVNAVFKGRQLIMRGHAPDKNLHGGMLEVMKSIGWAFLSPRIRFIRWPMLAQARKLAA